MPKQVSPVTEETFAPILYVMKYSDFDAVLDEHNAVGAGLSSSIFTRDLQESERFLGVDRFGLRHCQCQHRHLGRRDRRCLWRVKETGGGRESGSDAWKAYMRRRHTNTVNYSKALPLAQGVFVSTSTRARRPAFS
ncbi:aldehyde dehydrogenase family protein, partial [Mesorhizobium calcicola]